MEILSDYPKQVVILKGTTAICGLSGRPAGLRRRMRSEQQTREFPAWCKRLKRTAQSGDLVFERHLTSLGSEANAHMNKVQRDAASLPEAIEALAADYGRDDVSHIRHSKFTDELINKLIKNILQTSAQLFKTHPSTRMLRNSAEVPNLFVFRSALMAHLLALKWIHFGGAKNVPAEKLRNDIIDVNFAAYATYFDGLLTGDKKLNELYTEGSVLLNSVIRREA